MRKFIYTVPIIKISTILLQSWEMGKELSLGDHGRKERNGLRVSAATAGLHYSLGGERDGKE